MWQDKPNSGWQVDDVQKSHEHQVEDLEAHVEAMGKGEKKSFVPKIVLGLLVLLIIGVGQIVLNHGDSLVIPTSCTLDIEREVDLGSHFVATCQVRQYSLRRPYFEFLGATAMTVIRIPI